VGRVRPPPFAEGKTLRSSKKIRVFRVFRCKKKEIMNFKYFNIQEFMCRCGCPMPAEVRTNIESLVINVLDSAREAFGAPVNVSSGHRCEARNKAVGGVARSQHMVGQAADLVTGTSASNLRLAQIIAQQGRFDQLILYTASASTLEPQFIHVSYKRLGDNRHRILRKVLGKEGYTVINNI